jgi:hypothetical protein
MSNKAKQSMSFMCAVAAISPDNGYLNTKRCRDCYYYSDVTVKMCELEHEPADPDLIACHMFEPKEEYYEGTLD